MNIHILRLAKSGMPLGWMAKEHAATLVARGRVLWQLGDTRVVLRGGTNAWGRQSRIELAPIMAFEQSKTHVQDKPALTNRMLFRRDNYRCLYCGKSFAATDLTRDHIVPRAQGGADTWQNVVAACKPCNNVKADRTPEQAGMPLLAIPFVPNPYEALYLANRHILADQTAYLASSFSSNRSWQ